LRDAVYDEAKVPQWINDICEDTIRKLCDGCKPYKYIGMASPKSFHLIQF
jgi:hypothetical protein